MDHIKKENKSSKQLMRESLLDCLLNFHNIHLESPFGNDVVSLDYFQHWILDFVDENPSSIKYISTVSNIDRRVVNSNVNYLLKMGLIQKKKDSKDGREILIYLSEYGLEIIGESRKQIEELLSFCEKKYSIKQERILTEFLEELSTSIKEIIDK